MGILASVKTSKTLNSKVQGTIRKEIRYFKKL